MLNRVSSIYSCKVEIDLNINKNEVLRYLGYKKGILIDDTTNNLIDECIQEVKELSRKNYAYSFHDIDIDSDVCIGDTDIVLRGEDIKKHLDGCAKCSVIAVTLGVDIDNRIRYYNKTDLTKAVIFNACASAAIEALCDTVNSLVSKIASNNGYGITSRYSPGYGDLPLEHQSDILDIIQGGSIGLTSNEDNILIPRKSVTAIIGIGNNIISTSKSCDTCSFRDNCLFIRDGDICGMAR